MCSDLPPATAAAVLGAVRHERYICANIDNNNNKFWNITLRSDFAVIAHWGRIGDRGQCKEFQHPDLASAERFFDRKCREKISGGNGYAKQKTITSDTPAILDHPVAKIALADLAARQIATGNSAETLALVRELSRQNIHNILQQTKITYGDDGLFRTPLGVVTQEGIDEARQLLAAMGGYVEAGDHDGRAFKKAVEQYWMAVPQDLGHGRPDLRALYPDLQALQAQNQILDSLQGSLQTVLTRAANPHGDAGGFQPPLEPILFDAKLCLVDDGKTLDRITRKYKATQHRIHLSSAYSVRRVFSVEVAAMRAAFEREGRAVGNVQELWHGTSVGNILSILKSGLKLAPPSMAHIAGKMFGSGLYFSDQSTKSLNYAAGYWNRAASGANAQTCYMFLFDVALGRTFTPLGSGQCSGWTSSKAGSDSTFARGGISGVLNNEMIVYRECQCAPAFLVEFTK